MNDTALLHWLQTRTGAGVFTIDADTRRLHWQPALFVLHGLDPGAPQPSLQQALAFVSPMDRSLVAEGLQKLLAGGPALDLEIDLLLPADAWHRVRLQAESQWEAGRCVAVLGVMQLASPKLAPALEYAVSAAGVGVWEVDLRDGSERWSDRTLEIYGLSRGSRAPSRDEWRSRFLHPDDAERAAARAQDMVRHRRPYELDYRIVRADGALRWLHSRAAFAPGEAHRVFGITLDITDRKRSEENAAESWRVLDLSASHVGFGYGFRDLISQEVHWSAQLKRLYGLAEHDSTPSREEFLALVVPEDRERVAEVLGFRLQRRARSMEFDIVRRGDGVRRTLASRATLQEDPSGRPVRLYFAVIDITEQRERDNERARLLEHLRLAAESSGIGTWTRDEATGQARWDVTERRLYGLPDDAPAPDLEGFLALVHPDDRPRLRRAFALPPPEDGVSGHEFRVVHPDGQVRWLHTRGRFELDAQGRVQRRLGISMDVTKLRQAEAALQAKELAERANQAKTEFLSRMSHELRTPLNAVLGFAQIMAMDAQDPLSAPQQQRIGHIQTAGWHLLALINDVLDLSRIEAQESRLEMTRVAITPLLQDVLVFNEVAAASRQVRLQLLPPAEPEGWVWADATRLRQVLVNLVSNAVKYNRAGGEVVVAVGSAATAAGPADVISVRDNGEGMSAAQLANLFQPFNRLGRESGGVEGTGIGLTLSKRLVEAMQGQLEVRSQPGRGSEFSVWLPRLPGLGL